MNRKAVILLGILAASAAADENSGTLHGIMAAAKLTGVCGTFHQMVVFQDYTKIQGGDEFIDQFLAAEAIRLGWSDDEFAKQCERSTTLYNELFESAKTNPPSPLPR
jgi:hypothetical protein